MREEPELKYTINQAAFEFTFYSNDFYYAACINRVSKI